jgi:uncharacterized iron-regulated membrane protein
MRNLLLFLHRWTGLAIAAFLVVSGLTGAVISWDHELDEWLNPQLYRAEWAGAPASALHLADRIEATHPGLVVTYLPLSVEPGHALLMSVDADRSASRDDRTDPTFNQVAVNPTSGDIQGRRMWGEPALTRENLLPFLYKLHYSMHIPDMAGVEVGVLFMGVIGILWLLDSFAALWLSFPSVRTWRKSFALRWRQGGFRRLFDLHRSGGVWTWLLVAVVAVTSVSMNLGTEVVRPLVNAVSPLSPSPFDARDTSAAPQAQVSRKAVLETATRAAVERGIGAPAGGLFYSPDFHVYGVGFFAPGEDHGDGGLGNPWLYFDAATGRPAGADIPGTGSAGDIFMQAQFPLHSGRIVGVPGRILVSILGLVVAGLSITGVMIWARKRAARHPKVKVRASPEVRDASAYTTETMSP